MTPEDRETYIRNARDTYGTDPLFQFLVWELKAQAEKMEEIRQNVLLMHRRCNALEQLNTELEWRMESYEALAQRMFESDPHLTYTSAHDVLEENPDLFRDDLMELLNEADTEPDDFDWDAWFDEGNQGPNIRL